MQNTAFLPSSCPGFICTEADKERGTPGRRSAAEHVPGVLCRLSGAVDVRRRADPHHSQSDGREDCPEMSDAQVHFYRELCMSSRLPQEKPQTTGIYVEARVRIRKALCTGCQPQVRAPSFQTCQPAAGAS